MHLTLLFGLFLLIQTNAIQQTNENISCPRDCICDSSFARCRSIDPQIQKFNSNIKVLTVTGLNRKQKVKLEAEMFKKMNLHNIQIIKIINTTISYMDDKAFNGLHYLTSVELVSANLKSISPNLFVTNGKLKRINLNNNPIELKYEYFLSSGTIEDLSISNGNLNSINDTTFIKMPNLLYINLSNNKITNISAKAFEKLADLQEVNLSNNLIETIHSNWFKNLKDFSILKLRNNLITSTFDLESDTLETLDVSYCKITKINYESFVKVPNLIELILDGNQITHLSPLEHLQELYSLDLTNTNLSVIPDDFFLENNELTVVTLKNNRNLKKLPSYGFEFIQNMTSITVFDVSYCALEQIDMNTFSTMPGLTELNLNNNQIKYIHEKAFSKLTSLTELNLANNLLTSPDVGLFLNLRDLRKLDLSHNPWMRLDIMMFQHLDNLQHLDVSYCQLSAIWTSNDEKLDKKLARENLQYLNVSNNDIKTVRDVDLIMMPKIRIFDIINNPLKCNSDLTLMVIWLNEKDVDTRRENSTRIQLNGRKLNKKQETSFWSKLGSRVCNGKPLPPFTSGPKIIEHLNENVDKIKINNDLTKSSDPFYDIPRDISYDMDDVDDDDDEESDDSEDSDYVNGEYEYDSNSRTDINDENVFIDTSDSYFNCPYSYLSVYIFSLVILASVVTLYLVYSRKSEHKIDNLTIATSSVNKTKTDCGLVYKQLSEDIETSKTPIFAKLYSPYLYMDSGKNSYKKIQPEEV